MRFINASCQHLVFELSGVFLWCRFVVLMEEDNIQHPSEPSHVPAVEVVNLEESDNDRDETFSEMMNAGLEDNRFAEGLSDRLSAGTLEDWDTSLVEPRRSEIVDKPVAKRDYDALLMSARLSLMEDQQLKLPWESGVLKSILDDDASISVLPQQVLSLPSGVLRGPVVEGASSSGDVSEPKPPIWTSRDFTLPIHACAIKVLPDRDFYQELDMLWHRAIDKWLRTFEILGYPGLLGDALTVELGMPNGGKSREMVRDSMGIKSPRTAIKRAQTMLKYFNWLQSNFDFWNPWVPTRCIDYMSVGNSKGPIPSKGTSLLEAFRFCRYVVSIPVPDEILSSPLVRGRAVRLSAEQVDYHPARSFSALEVATLEKMMLTDMDPVDKYMLGAVVFCLYSRSRWSDVKQIHQLWIEESTHEGELFGFIEGTTQHHKTATSLTKKRKFMPIVCPLLGITGCNWVEAWMQSWVALGVDINQQPFGPLCRAASSEGGLCKRACTTDEINVYINAVMKTTDLASSHSLKHTTLEWSSAYGIDEDARKLLGHHALSGDKALAVYSRDLLNRPLQVYCSMLRNIRLDHFRPDESRTSRLIDALKIQAGVQAVPSQEKVQQMARSVEVPTTTEEAQPSETDNEVEPAVTGHDESSSSSSSSSSEDDDGDDAKHDVELHDWIVGPVWRNKRSKVVHRTSFSSTMTACGRSVDISRFDNLVNGCSTMFARCSICFRGEVVATFDGMADAFDAVRSKRARRTET